ncbi:MAG TPA: tetratricopeptide repeat protein [Candidatus Acidoferrales bacterium]|nr:tetratricopeptide repeat protein [Candidatus Acidoferrales bacterium]
MKIQDQPFRVLLLLLEHPGEIVSREQLRQNLWPEGTYVDFDGSLNVILKKLRAAIDDNSDNPRFVETIPRRGYRFIAPVSVRNGANSGASADAAPTDAAVPQIPEFRPESIHQTLAKSKNQLTFFLYAVSALLVLAFVVAGSLALYRKAKSPVPAKPLPRSSNPTPVRESIAVLGFHNVSGRPEDAWLGTAVSEMLRTELAGGEKLRLVSGEDVANLRLKASWPQTDTFDPNTTARIGAALNSDLLVLGSYTVISGTAGGRLRVDARLQDTKTGEILSEVAENGSGQDLFRIVSRVGAALRDRLGVPALAETDEAGVLASVPLDPDAARFYALGLTKLRDFDASAAKDLLEQATKADPKFSLAHAMLARAYYQLGYEQKRKEEAKKAWDLSTDLPRAERMLVEGDYYESLADHEKAVSTYHALFELFPDNVDYGLQLASTQILAGQLREAHQTLESLRRLLPPASDDPRIDLAESRTISKDPQAQLGLLRDAMRKAAAQGKGLILAQARKDECMVLAYTYHLDQATAACQDAYNTFLSAGNRLGAADSLRLMGDIEGSQGYFQQCISTYQRALQILKELGEHEKTGAVLNNMAIGFENEGSLDQAERFYREAKSHFDAAGDRANASTALGNIADALYLRGDLRGAEKLYQQTITIRSSMEFGDTGYALYRLADLELTEGRVQDARQGAEQAIKVMRSERGAYQYLTGAMIVLGSALQAAGDLEGARQQYQQTLEIRQKAGEMELVAESQVALAELALDQGKPAEAESLLRTAVPKLEKEKVDPETADAYTLLSRALLAEGKTPDAGVAIAKAEELSSATSDPALKLPLAIQRARIEVADAHRDAGVRLALAHAREQLYSVAESAAKLGYYQIGCQARLAVGQLEMRQSPSLGRSRLAALAAEARSRGLELLARQAEQTMVGPLAGIVDQKRPQ